MNKSKFNYFIYSKNIITSLFFIFPFILLYESICFLYFKNSTYQVRNSADVVVRNFFDIFGPYSDYLYALTLSAILLFIYFINKSLKFKNVIEFKYLIIMFFEGILFGLLLVLLLNNINYINTYNVDYQIGLLLNLYLSIGAGIWEEILFRLFIFTFIYKIIKYYVSIDFYNLFISVFLSSIIFSTFHYVGINSDIFNIHSFIIRFLGGVFLSLLFYYRGFGIASISHISYDFILTSLPLIYTN